MKQTIEIEVPDGKKAIWKDNKVIFEDIKPQLPKTWIEFCNQNKIRKGECFIDIYGDTLEHGEGVDRSYVYDRNTLPSKQAVEQHLALMQLHQLRDCYRQGWIPNCSDNNYIYSIYRDYNIVNEKYEYKIEKFIHTEYFLSFQSRDVADEFLTNFRELIEQAGDLI